MGPCIVNVSMTNKMQRSITLFIIVNALHISSDFSAHHQELKIKKLAGSIYNCTAKDVDVTTSSRRTSTVVNGTLLEQWKYTFSSNIVYYFSSLTTTKEPRLYIRAAMLLFSAAMVTPPSCFRCGAHHACRCDVTFPSQAALSTEL
jgi:hypothetical protein